MKKAIAAVALVAVLVIVGIVVLPTSAQPIDTDNSSEILAPELKDATFAADTIAVEKTEDGLYAVEKANGVCLLYDGNPERSDCELVGAYILG